MGNKGQINVDYVAAIQQRGNLLYNVEIPTNKPMWLIEELRALVDSPSRTVWDMISLFTEYYPRATSINYIYPQYYDDSFVSGADYPQPKSYDDLKIAWEKSGEKALETYKQECNRYGIEYSDEKAHEKKQSAVEKEKRSQKVCFMSSAERWINANAYKKLCEELATRNDIKVFSREDIGWRQFIYPISDDIKITLSTNFGFGGSAYFFLLMEYKNIKVIPYSFIVRYYYANVVELIQCTRKYCLERESWIAAFDLITELVNSASVDPIQFIHSYVMSEVREMMRGLESIMNHPDAYIRQICEMRAPLIVNVGSINSIDKDRMRLYPSEFKVLFKAEKITSALDFLNSLNEISGVVNEVNPYVNRLIEMNFQIYPEVISTMSQISKHIEVQEVMLRRLEKKLEIINRILKLSEIDIENKRKNQESRSQFNMTEYEKSHPRYVTAKLKANVLSSRKRECCAAIIEYKRFNSHLEESISKIEELKAAV